ncbi:hypothetical protein A6A25_30450 [Saccharothrix sp. CB00851]|nr:hypothetical protein A6A25_30450 [Saccharothrix sp. CB00851]
MRPDAVDHYVTLLADDGALPSEAFCLTVVRGLSVAEALTRFDAPPSGWTTTLADAGPTSVAAYPDELPLVVADHLDGWTLPAEDNGYHGAQEEVVATLSVGTVAASVHWNVEFDSNLVPDGDLLARAHAEYREALHLRWRRCLPRTLPADPVERLQAEFRRRDADTGAERAAVARAHALAATAASRVADPAEALGWAVYNAIQADRAVEPHRLGLEWVQRLT